MRHGMKRLLGSVILGVLLAHGNAFNVASTGHMGLLRNAGSRTTVARHRGQARPLSLLLSTAPSEGGRDGILIVGGGPSGLGAALELDTIMNSELRGMWGGMGSTITVVEKMQPMSSYDPTKGFMYLVSEPGLKFCDRHGLSQTVAQEGVDGSTLNGNRIAIDGTRSKFTFSFGDIRAPYWLPRHGFVSILENAVRARPSVDLKDGWEVKELRRVQDGGDTVVEALLHGPGGEQSTMRPFLIVGADGLSSVVRTSLSRWAAEDGDNSGKFEMYETPSASGGLRYKVLKLKGSFPLPPAPAAKGAEARSSSTRDMIEPDKSYSFLSRYQGSLKDKNRETRLGLLPLKERYGYRTANIITLPDHSIWTNATLSTQAGMKAFLSESYPQMDWASAVTEEELERFAKSPGGRFPQPQTTGGGAAWISKSKRLSVGVVLLGDALHAFPPDLGQGVNSALRDVCLLGDALRTRFKASKVDRGNLIADALASYEVEATGEAKALVRLMQLGSPYQYSQPGVRAKVAATLMAANLLLRLVFSKLPMLGNRFFYPQISMLSQLSGNLSYREMLSRAHRTSFAFGALGIALGMSVVTAFVGTLPYTVWYWCVAAMWACAFKAYGM